MKLACISTILGYPWGSPDRLWCDLAARCQRRGDRVFVGVSALTADSDAVRDLRRNGAELFLRERNSVFLGRRDHWLRQLPGRRSRHIDLQLQKFRSDVVVITQGGTHDVLSESYLVRWLEHSGVPFVVVCHNNQEECALAAEEVRLLRHFFANAAAVSFVSSHNLLCAERQLGISLPRARIVQNPLAVDDPGPLPWPDITDRAQLGLVGRIDVQHKGIDLLFEALASLKSLFPFLVTLTGRCDDPGAIRAQLERLALTDHVRLQPPIAGAGIIQSYQAMELFLLTSRYEGCASAMLEALMCGRPVLATPVGGVSDWIEDSVSGFVTADTTVTAIRDTLLRALPRRCEWRAMGEAARRSFETRRDPDPARTFRDLVDEVLIPASPAHSQA